MNVKLNCQIVLSEKNMFFLRTFLSNLVFLIKKTPCLQVQDADIDVLYTSFDDKCYVL